MTPLTALVVAHRGGEALAATLTSVGWAGRRCVADPARGVPADGWPAGVERWPVADVGATVHPIADLPGGRFSRYYSPEMFRTRVVDAVPALTLRLYRLSNPEAAGPECYLRYAAVFEKTPA